MDVKLDPRVPALVILAIVIGLLVNFPIVSIVIFVIAISILLVLSFFEAYNVLTGVAFGAELLISIALFFPAFFFKMSLTLLKIITVFIIICYIAAIIFIFIISIKGLIETVQSAKKEDENKQEKHAYK